MSVLVNIALTLTRPLNTEFVCQLSADSKQSLNISLQYSNSTQSVLVNLALTATSPLSTE